MSTKQADPALGEQYRCLLCPQSRPQALALRMSDLGCKVQIETLIAIANQEHF